MSGLKAVLTFDDSWDDEGVRNAFEDSDQFPGVTVSEVISTNCGVCTRQNAKETPDNNAQQLKAEIAKLVERAKQSACAGDCGTVRYLLEQIGSQLSAV